MKRLKRVNLESNWVGFGELKLFSPALELLYRTPSLITNPLQMIPTKLLPLRTMDERRAIHNTFRLRNLNSQNTDGKSLEGGGEVGRREERSFGRIHVCLQGTAENCASTTLIGGPFELTCQHILSCGCSLFPD